MGTLVRGNASFWRSIEPFSLCIAAVFSSLLPPQHYASGCPHPHSCQPALLSPRFLCLFRLVPFLAFLLAKCLILFPASTFLKTSTIIGAAILPPSSWNWNHTPSFQSSFLHLSLSSIPRRTQAVENWLFLPHGEGQGISVFKSYSLSLPFRGMFPLFCHVPCSRQGWQLLPGLDWEFGTPLN